MLKTEEYFYRANTLKRLTDPCILCAKKCKARRFHNQVGFCGGASFAKLAAALPHKGEEPPFISGSGSGTVFFSGCSGRCLFCQNYQISHFKNGTFYSPLELANIFLKLQDAGCSNINLVTPVPHLPFIVESLGIARSNGLIIPSIFNTNAYLLPEIIDIIENIFEIYLPDFKYGQDLWAERFSGFKNYFETASQAIQHFFLMSGPLSFEEGNDKALSGVLVRHLVLPGGYSGSFSVLKKLLSISSSIPVSLMAQYKPAYKALSFSALNKTLPQEEYQEIVEYATLLGFETIYVQSYKKIIDSYEYLPDFNLEKQKIFPGNM